MLFAFNTDFARNPTRAALNEWENLSAVDEVPSGISSCPSIQKTNLQLFPSTEEVGDKHPAR